MKKIVFILFTLIGAISCTKESELPPEFELIEGDWRVFQYSVTYNATTPWVSRDTFSSENLGYDFCLSISKDKIIERTENTIVRESQRIVSVDAVINHYQGNDSLLCFLIYFRTNEPFTYSDLSVAYNFSTCEIETSKASENFETITTFYYKRM